MQGRLIGPRVIAVVAILSTAPGLAFAYIDPGSGAYMVQALFALCGAALFYIRHPIRTIRSLGNRLFRRSNAQDPPPLGEGQSVSPNPQVTEAEGVSVSGTRELHDRL